MSDLSFSQTLVPITVLSASFLGSLHCVSMCGGLVLAAAPTKLSAFFYQLGRLLGYASLGAIAGLFGQRYLAASMYGSVIPIIAALAIGVTFIFLGISHLIHINGSSQLRMPAWLTTWYAKISRKLLANPDDSSRALAAKGFVVGTLSVFLPCGWLYSFVLAAVSTGSLVAGISTLSLFWLGTLPALSIAPLTIRKVLRPVGRAIPGVVGIAFITAGIATLTLKVAPLRKSLGNSPSAQCPLHMKQRAFSASGSH